MGLSSEAAVWREGFTQQGKWMDGWETRRKRIPGHDWCIIRLGLPGMVHGVQLDTSFFTGNFAPRASVQAARLDSDPVIGNRTGDRGVAASEEQLKSAAELRSDTWDTLVEMTPLGAGYKDTCNSYFTVGTGSGQGPYTHIRLNIYPDGAWPGVACSVLPRLLILRHVMDTWTWCRPDLVVCASGTVTPTTVILATLSRQRPVLTWAMVGRLPGDWTDLQCWRLIVPASSRFLAMSGPSSDLVFRELLTILL